jgi:hypothetical protein
MIKRVKRGPKAPSHLNFARKSLKAPSHLNFTRKSLKSPLGGCKKDQNHD